MVITIMAMAALAMWSAVPYPAMADGDPEIIGGEIAPPGTFGYQVALLARGTADRRDAFFCGGSLISPDTVLTAAHCVSEPVSSFSRPDQVDVLAGTLDLSSGGRRVHVRRIRVHPLFASSAPRFDVAVLQLWASLPETLVRPASAADVGVAAPGVDAAVAGWGSTSNLGRYPAHLRWTTLAIRYDSVCRNRIGPNFDAETMVCAGGPAAGVGSCWGDSGGPLTVEVEGTPVQVGIVSFGATETCADGNPEAVTRVSRVAGFVTPYLDPDSGPGPPSDLTGRRVPGGVTLSWSAPVFDGGTAVKGYEVRWEELSPSGRGGRTIHLDRHARGYAVGGLVPGDRYRFTVLAFNVIGDGEPSVVTRAAG